MKDVDIGIAVAIAGAPSQRGKRRKRSVFCRGRMMGGLKVFLRILLSLSVFIAGFGHAMPMGTSGGGSAGAVVQSHCEEHAAQAMHGVAHAGLHLPLRHASSKHPATSAGCCKANACPCPQVAAVSWEREIGVGSPGHHSPDFAPLRSDYRSPVLERLIRPPIV